MSLFRSFRVCLCSASAIPVLLAVALTACGPRGDVPDGEQPAGAAAGGVVPASRVEAQFFLTREQTHNKFSRAIPPVLLVPSGAVVEVETKEASDGQFVVGSTVEEVATLDFEPIHPLTGPIAVEGAEPGDVLKVTLLEIELGNYGWVSVSPGFGWLAEDFPEAYIKTFQFEKGADVVRFADGIEIPLAPFPGVMGVAPDTDEMLSTIPPRKNGGNMDNKYMREGTTVYFPVLVPGANFSIGDTHAVQGDGEVCGTAIEAPMRIVFKLEVLKGGRSISEPEYETDEYYGVTAFATTIDEAAKKATRYMIDYLEAEHGMDRTEAYVLCSLAGDLKISEVVDVPHVLVSMHMPKGIFLKHR
jgi:acetamidase/formamidase